MLDSNFMLKICDFGFAILLSGRDGSGMLHTHLGTESYMAPEIHSHSSYSGAAVDLFAAGIILFIMLSQNPPFSRAEPNDPFYKMFVNNQVDKFWSTHGRHKGPTFYSEEFKNLLTTMVAYDPTMRLSLSELKAHPWCAGPVAGEEDIESEF